MRINTFNKQSFGKLYADKKVLDEEINKLNPKLRPIAKKALKSMNDFRFFDMYVRKDSIEVIDKSDTESIPCYFASGTRGFPLFKNDNGENFYNALCYIFENETKNDIFFVSLKENSENKKTEDMLSDVSRIYKHGYYSGALEEIYKSFCHQRNKKSGDLF